MGQRGVKILVLSFYFRPDLSAGSFRATALVDALCKAVPAGSQIDVITTLPNRYHSFSADAPQPDQQAGLSIFRIALPKHQSGLLDQSRAFLTFSREATRQAARRDYDLVYATSSRLMTAVLGAWIARRKNARFYLDIRDIFVDTIQDVLPRKVSWVVKPVFEVLEKWAIKQADKVNLVSSGFSQYFSTRYPQHRFSYFTNGVDDEFLAAAPTQSSVPDRVAKNQPLTVLYAGNLGEGQGLHAIIPELAKSMGSRIHFKIIGDGGRKHALEAALSKLGVTNVELLPPVKRDELLDAYRAANVLFLHLNDYDAFKKVLPSKLFEYAALGKPVWAGVAGYPAEFVRSEISNAAVFHPCDVEGAVQAFDELALQDAPRTAFVMKYARANISQKMAEDVLSVASGKCSISRTLGMDRWLC
jgi:glycosyltransferase involved in cell wall biosynthesis